MTLRRLRLACTIYPYYTFQYKYSSLWTPQTRAFSRPNKSFSRNLTPLISPYLPRGAQRNIRHTDKSTSVKLHSTVLFIYFCSIELFCSIFFCSIKLFCSIFFCFIELFCSIFFVSLNCFSHFFLSYWTESVCIHNISIDSEPIDLPRINKSFSLFVDIETMKYIQPATYV